MSSVGVEQVVAWCDDRATGPGDTRDDHRTRSVPLPSRLLKLPPKLYNVRQQCYSSHVIPIFSCRCLRSVDGIPDE